MKIAWFVLCNLSKECRTSEETDATARNKWRKVTVALFVGREKIDSQVELLGVGLLQLVVNLILMFGG